MCRFRFPAQCPFKKFLSRNIVSPIQFDYAAIIKRVSVARQGKFGAKPRFGHREIGARTGGHFRYRGVFLDQRAKAITSLSEMATGKLSVSSLKSL
jgi:hypothetical protein